MKIVICQQCGKEEKVSPSRAKSYVSCSHTCSSLIRKAKTGVNVKCTQCTISFHLKPSQIKRYNRTLGTFCSTKCSSLYKRELYKGDKNPNYRGKQYDQDGYRINHYPKVGRIKEHHYITFLTLGITKLPKGYCIHHKDCNIYNNLPENLALLSNSNHRWLHKQFGNATLWAFENKKISFDRLVEWSNDKEKCQLLLINLFKQKENGITNLSS